MCIVEIKTAAHDFSARLLAELEFCHRIGCDAVSASQYDGKILIRLTILQENKHHVPL